MLTCKRLFSQGDSRRHLIMLIITASGFTTGEPKIEDTEYGKRATVSIRAKTTNGKQTHYINAVFYGKKIDVVERFMEDGRQITVAGAVRNISSKTKKDGTPYSSLYIDVSDFTLPEKLSDAPRRPSQPSEEEIPF